MGLHTLLVVVGIIVVAGLGMFMYVEPEMVPALPVPSVFPTPLTPSQASSCEQDVATAQKTSQGQICTQVVTTMSCPSDNTYRYTARDGCESGYLLKHGWKALNPSEELY